MTKFQITLTSIASPQTLSVAAQVITSDGITIYGTAGQDLAHTPKAEHEQLLKHIKAAAIGELVTKLIQDGSI